MTATLAYTSSRTIDNAVRVARVAAAGRVRAARERAQALHAARRARAEQAATEWIAELREAGAILVGFKICSDIGKYRMRQTLDDAWLTLVMHWGGDVEAWGIDAENEFVGEVW